MLTMAMGGAAMSAEAMNAHMLVLGGTRSGKSAYAERAATGARPAYLATAEPGDEEMRARIERHRSERQPAFVTYEEPLAVVERLAATGEGHDVVVLDCVSLWISNLMAAAEDVEARVAALVEWLAHNGRPRLIIVSSEVGLGVVPEHPLGREYRDLAGRAHQRLAAACDTVVLMVAGLPVAIKGELPV